MENMDAQAALEALAAELERRGWSARIRGDVLKVINPAAPQLNDEISCGGQVFRWAWGQDVGPVGDVSGAAERIAHVLREVGA